MFTWRKVLVFLTLCGLGLYSNESFAKKADVSLEKPVKVNVKNSKKNPQLEGFFNVISLNKPQHCSVLSGVLSHMGFGEIDILTRGNDDNKKMQIRHVTSRERQIALLENLYMSGAFHKSIVTYGIKNMGGCFGYLCTDVNLATEIVHRVMEEAGAYQTDFRKFNAEIVIDKLFHSRKFDAQDVEDLMLYFFQVVYTRKPGLEVSEAKNIIQDDGKVQISSGTKYMENAKILGFYEAFSNVNKADALWIMGCARPEYERRLKFLKSMNCESGNCKNLEKLYSQITLSTRWRRLSVENDCINIEGISCVDEGMRYISRLARSNQINPKRGSMFVEYNNGSVKRLYFNDNGEIRETLMVDDMFNKIIGNVKHDYVDTKPKKGQERPTTVDCVIDQVDKIKDILSKQKNVRIVVLSSQPNALRQAGNVKSIVSRFIKENNLTTKDLEVGIISPPLCDDDSNCNKRFAVQIAISSFGHDGYVELVKDYKNRKRSISHVMLVAKESRNLHDY